MRLCGDDCCPCCDFCIHVIYDEINIDGVFFNGGPVDCSLHKDDEHQNIVDRCGYCDDFHCLLCDKPND